MPHADFEPESLARYLHISPQQVLKMAERGSVPGRKIGGQWRFSQAEIHHWLEERIGAAGEADLAHVQELLDKAAEQKEPATVRISELLAPEAIAIPLDARTRSSVIKSMVELAARTGHLWTQRKWPRPSRPARICTQPPSTTASPCCTRGVRWARSSPSRCWRWDVPAAAFPSAASGA